MNFVADTHALLWWFTNSPRISSKASTAKFLKLPIITKDKILQKLPSIKTIW